MYTRGMGTWKDEIEAELSSPRADLHERLPPATEEEHEEFWAELEAQLEPPELIVGGAHGLMWPGGPRPPWWQRQPEDYQQPYETLAQYEERKDRFADLVVRVDRARGFPRVLKLIKILGSPAALEHKKAAVEGWLAWARDFCAPRPPSLIHGRMVILWSGCSIGYLLSTRYLHGSPEWEGYQRELRVRSEAKRKRPYRDRRQEKKVKRAMEALDKIVQEPDTQEPKQLARRIQQARKRILALPPELAQRYRGLMGIE